MATVYKRDSSPYYQANIIVRGIRRRVSTQETNRRDAQKKADLIEQAENDKLSQTDGLSFSEGAARFFKVKNLKDKTVSCYKSSFRNLYSVLGDFSLPRLQNSDVHHYVNERMKVTGSVSIRRDLAFLSSLFTIAKHWDISIKDNPARSYEKKGLPEAKERNRWLRPEEIDKLLAACSQSYQRVFILLLVDTGMRSSEARKLEWSEIDLKEGVIILANLDASRTKSGQSRIVPMTDRLIDTLTVTQKESHHRWVFYNATTGKPMTTFKTFWGNVTKEARLKGLRIHDLRHTYASLGKQRGIDETTLMDIMGHRTRSMVKRYSHTSIESLKAAGKKDGGMSHQSSQNQLIEIVH